jgi:hypothetical protein
MPSPSPLSAPSLLDHPAQPAKITLAAGKLTVMADNSSLSEILHQVSAAGGMKIDGLVTGGSGDPRIFGSYGPAAPRDVLSDLLNGSGYNVLMLGETTAGLPRELALTARTAGGVPNPPPNAARNDENDVEVAPTQYPEEQEPIPPPPMQPGGPNRVRTPQEMLQELQKMHDQQQQQQQQQPQQQEIDSTPN